MSTSNEEKLQCGICYGEDNLGNVSCCLKNVCDPCLEKWKSTNPKQECPFCRHRQPQLVGVEKKTKGRKIKKTKKIVKKTITITNTSDFGPIDIFDEESSLRVPFLAPFINFLPDVQREDQDLKKAVDLSIEEEKKRMQDLDKESTQIEQAIRASLIDQ